MHSNNFTKMRSMSGLSLSDKFAVIKNNRFVFTALPFFLLLVVIVFFGATTDNFFGATVLTGIFNQAVIFATLAISVSLIYTAGNLDISIGSAMALCSILAANIYISTGSVVLMIISSIALGIVLMSINSTLSTVLNVKAATVGIVMMQIYSAIRETLLGNDAKIVVSYKMSESLESGFRPIAFILFFLLVFIVYTKTPVGRKTRFYGGNANAAIQAGISKVSLQYIGFIICGLGVGLTGIFSLIRTSGVTITTGDGMGMNVMLATVLGGMSIFGGAKSNSYAGLIGALTVAALNKGLLMIGVSAAIVQGVRGLIFLLIIYLSSERQATLPSRQQF